MQSDVLISLMNNAALLLALGVAYDALSATLRPNTLLKQALTGFVAGFIGIAVMITPLHLVPGIFFDTRSILLGVVGLFFGPLPTVITVLFTATLRLYQGGAGALTGAGVILSSAGLGLLWRRMRPRPDSGYRLSELYGLGLAVHVVMLLWMLTLPHPVNLEVLRQIALPVLLIYPVGTVLLGRLLDLQIGRRQTEEALRLSEEKYRLFLQNFTGIAYQASARTGEVYLLHGEVEEITGYSPTEILTGAVSWDSIVHPEDRDLVHDEEERLVSQIGYVADRTYRIIRRDGQIRWVHDIGRAIPTTTARDHPSLIQGAIYDVTSQKAAEQELTVTLQRLSLATEAAEIGIWDLNLAEDVLTWDDRMFEMYRVRPEDFTHDYAAWARCLHPDDREVTEEAFRHAVDEGEDYHAQFRVVWPDGQIHYLEAHAAIQRAYDGNPQRVIGVNLDVTQRKDLESQIAQTQKMEAMGRLAGGIAHDFNNLLVPIIGYAELSLLKLPPDHELTPSLEHIKDAAEHAADLIKQILAFSRQQVLEMEIVDLNRLIEEFGAMLRRLIGEDIELNTNLAPDLAPVKGDKSQLGQVLLNLAINARDAMPDGGVLTVETAALALHDTSRAQLSELKPGPYVSMTVSDSGAGMDPATAEHIFEPFFTTKDLGQGTGLGLSTVLGIVQQHQGAVSVDSKPGHGTRFTILLPAATEPAPDEPRRQPLTTPTHGTETVLVVEDDASVRQVVTDTLARYGYQVLVAPDAPAAVEIVQQHSEPIDLLLTDVIMPHMKGTELYRQLAQLLPELKVVFMSGYADDVLTHHGALGPGQAFLPKPFSIRTLLDKIRSTMG